MGRDPDPDYLALGDVARQMLGEQCQYIAPYVAGDARRPALGEGLRITGAVGDYHAMRIHRDDVAVFVERVRLHRDQIGRR